MTWTRRSWDVNPYTFDSNGTPFPLDICMVSWLCGGRVVCKGVISVHQRGLACCGAASPVYVAVRTRAAKVTRHSVFLHNLFYWDP
jgi:hypothetical protein